MACLHFIPAWALNDQQRPKIKGHASFIHKQTSCSEDGNIFFFFYSNCIDSCELQMKNLTKAQTAPNVLKQHLFNLKYVSIEFIRHAWAYFGLEVFGCKMLLDHPQYCPILHY